MPEFQFEAMDAQGQEIKDVIEAATEEEAQTTIRQMGYFVTKISPKRATGTGGTVGRRKRRSFVIGGGGAKRLTTFTRQLSILQDAGLPILRSLKILELQAKSGKLKNALMDVCEEIESGATLSEAMGKCPKVFNRLYINMIKAGEAGGALEVILQRLADFMERAQSLKRKVKGAMIYPCVVIMVAIGILTFIMIKIVPVFKTLFEDFELELPAMTQLLMAISDNTLKYGFLLPLVPLFLWLFVKLLRKFRYGRMGWDLYLLKLPVVGMLIEKNCMARTTRTLGTLVASGVPILDGLNITRETAGNAMFEVLYGKIAEAIREGETMAVPMRANARPPIHFMALFFWAFMGSIPGLLIMPLPTESGDMVTLGGQIALVGAVICGLVYLIRARGKVVDELVINMVDVGEETGELDTMLYKVADQFDEEVKTLTDGLMALMEPILIVFLGVAVGFIVIALFLPLVDLISNLSG